MTKTLNVEIDATVNNTNAAKQFIEELEHQYADLTVSNINISSNKVSFSIASPGMDDLTAADVKFRIDEFVSMNVPPFTIKKINVS